MEFARRAIWWLYYLDVFTSSSPLLYATHKQRQQSISGGVHHYDDIWWRTMTSTSYHLWSPISHLRYLPASFKEDLPPVLVLNADMDFGLETDGARYYID